jgi:hypothetical protein
MYELQEEVNLQAEEERESGTKQNDQAREFPASSGLQGTTVTASS